MSKEKEPCKCLLIIVLDSVIKAKKLLSSSTFGRMQTWILCLVSIHHGVYYQIVIKKLFYWLGWNVLATQ